MNMCALASIGRLFAWAVACCGSWVVAWVYRNDLGDYPVRDSMVVSKQLVHGYLPDTPEFTCPFLDILGSSWIIR